MAAKYAAVSVEVGSDCCEAASDLADHVFLVGEVPLFPLRDCTEQTLCRCRYSKRNDRREDDDDRRSFVTEQRSLMYGGLEKRRNRRGRRADD